MLTSPADIVARAKAATAECSISDVVQCLDSDTLVIDVREPAELGKGRICGAVHVPRGVLEFEIHKLVEEMCGISDTPGHEYPIVVCCGTSGRSALAAQSLQSLGYKNVKSMAGGMAAWAAANLPIE